MINRFKTFEKRHEYEVMKPRPEKIIVSVKTIDDNGNLITQDIEQDYNPTEILYANPPYTDKIEYMQLYGTIQDGELVMYDFARTSDMSDSQIIDRIKTIMKNNKK